MKRLFALTLALAVVALPEWVRGQTPDRRGEVALDRPEYQGKRANAPIPPALHVRNEGGSDGAGLCVISSILANGQYQKVPGLEGAKSSELWRTAKARRGGYSPDKLAGLVNEVMPAEKWASYTGRDTTVLDRLSSQGYPVGVTMNTGQLYGYRPIHHMVSLVHYSKADNLAAVVDNNRPGFFSFMPAAEFDRRWIDGGMGWAWVWTRKRPVVVAVASGLFLAGSIYALAVVFLAAGKARRLRGGV